MVESFVDFKLPQDKASGDKTESLIPQTNKMLERGSGRTPMLRGMQEEGN